MSKKNKIGTLNIIEPWELGTEKAISVSIVDEYQGQYLIFLSIPLSAKGKTIRYLIGEPRRENFDLFSDKFLGSCELSMIYSDEIDEQNFKTYHIKDFRQNFLLGEIIFA
jgi:hypothetical protein